MTEPYSGHQTDSKWYIYDCYQFWKGVDLFIFGIVVALMFVDVLQMPLEKQECLNFIQGARQSLIDDCRRNQYQCLSIKNNDQKSWNIKYNENFDIFEPKVTKC